MSRIWSKGSNLILIVKKPGGVGNLIWNFSSVDGRTEIKTSISGSNKTKSPKGKFWLEEELDDIDEEDGLEAEVDNAKELQRSRSQSLNSLSLSYS